MAHNFYAVKRGFDKEQNKQVTDIISSEWSKIKPLVIGYDDARYKGFDTEEEAKVWLSVVDRVDAEKRSKDTIDKAKKELGIETNVNNSGDLELNLDIKEIEALKDKGYSKYEVYYHLTRSLTDYLEKVYGK
jgi:viroplasmin and RNaseH domain-containing protein